MYSSSSLKSSGDGRTVSGLVSLIGNKSNPSASSSYSFERQLVMDRYFGMVMGFGFVWILVLSIPGVGMLFWVVAQVNLQQLQLLSNTLQPDLSESA